MIWNTMVFAVGGALGSVTFGLVYAWIVHRTDVPGKRVLALLPISVITIPLITKAFAYILVFSPFNGFANQLVDWLFGIKGPVFNIYTMWGMIFAGFGGTALCYLVISPAVMSFDASMEEVSRSIGFSTIGTFFRITLPILLPAVLSAFLLVTIDLVDLFDIPFIIGGGAHIRTLATEVFYWTNQTLPPRYDVATAISIIYVAIALVLLTTYIYVTRKTFRFVTITGRATRQTVNKLGRWKWVAFSVCFSIFFILYAMPMGVLVAMSFSSTGLLTNYEFSIDNYSKMFDIPLFWPGLTNSLEFAFLAGLFGTLGMTFVSYSTLKSRFRGSRVLEYLYNSPLAFPGIVYGLALFLVFLLAPGISALLYGTIWPFVIALVAKRTPHMGRIISGNLIQMADELEDSSRVARAKWGRTFYRIILPLLKNGLINSFIYTFVDSFRELGSVVLLTTGNTPLLIVIILDLFENEGSFLNVIAAASVFMSIAMMLSLVAARVFQRYLVTDRVKRPK